MVTVFPEPDVERGLVPAATVAPKISRIFAKGIAIPESVTKLVGI